MGLQCNYGPRSCLLACKHHISFSPHTEEIQCEDAFDVRLVVTWPCSSKENASADLLCGPAQPAGSPENAIVGVSLLRPLPRHGGDTRTWIVNAGRRRTVLDVIVIGGDIQGLVKVSFVIG
jgi:hypothetical protein